MPTSSAKPPPTRKGGDADPLAEPPWSRVRRVQLIRREIREYLPASAIELLLSSAEHVVEGGVEAEAGGAGSEIFASVMTTIDLEAAADTFREPADAATAQRVAELMADQQVVHSKLTARARAALADLAEVDPGSLEISLDYQVRAQANRVFLDADVVASPRRRRRG